MKPQYSQVTAPSSEPITTDQAAAHLRVDSADDLDYIGELISVAREYVEGMTGRVSLVSDWRVIASSWCDFFESHQDGTMYAQPMPFGFSRMVNVDTINIYRTPLVAVASVQYYPRDSDTLATMDPASYVVVTGAEPGRIKITGDFPDVANRPDAIQINFSAGHQSAALVSPGLRHAMKLMVGHLYETRTPVAFVTQVLEIPYTLKALIESKKVGGWFS